jgi:proteasome lid subunit RPN8/RPN11
VTAVITPAAALFQLGAARTAEDLSLIAWRERRSECGGLVWGRICSGPRGAVAWIAAMTPGIGRASAVDFQMDPASYVVGQRMLRQTGFPDDLDELGLWHSHPGYGCFLSSTDAEYFRLCYPQSWKVSVVVDPLTLDRGVFVKNPLGIEQIPGYLYTGSGFGPVPEIPAELAWAAVQEMIK